VIPDHWYLHKPRFFTLYEKIQELGVPVLFHSVILFGLKDSSRFCNPCNHEVLIDFLRLRFALAHVSCFGSEGADRKTLGRIAT